jgi:hypothetical protein
MLIIVKIRMRHAAIGAPVAVNHTAVEPVNRLKILTVLGEKYIVNFTALI